MPEGSGDGEVIIIRDTTIESRSVIAVQETETLGTISYIKLATSKTIESRSDIFKPGSETIKSLSAIKTTESNTIGSFSLLLSEGQHIIRSNSAIQKSPSKTLESRSCVLTQNQETLESRSWIMLLSGQKTIKSRSYIEATPQKTLSSNSVISVPCLAGDMADGMWLEFMEETRQIIVYKDFSSETEDPMTGQKVKGTANEYTICARIEVQKLSDKLVKYGTLDVGDAIIYLPARIRYDSDWTALTGVGDIRPHKYDEIKYRGMTYRISEITFFKMGKTEIYCECYCTRVNNEKGEEYS